MLDKGGVQEVSKKGNLNRSSTYVTLQSLVKKGLASVSDGNKVRQFFAAPPETLVRMAEKRMLEKQQTLNKIERILPEMKAIYKGTNKKPTVKVYEGKEGLINTYEDVLRCQEKIIRVYAIPGYLGDFVYDYIPSYMKRREELGIKMLGIFPDTEENRKMLKKAPKTRDLVTFISMNKKHLHSDLCIYDDKISYMTKENGGVGIILESAEVSEVMKTLFDLAFNESRRSNKLKLK
jgi:sugar-specific transcriptional regulator TrmB